MMWRPAMYCMWRVREGSPCHRWGSGGPPPWIFFCKCKVWEGHDRAILKAPGKKRLKEFFHRNLEKKVFASKKRFKRFPRGACIQDVNTYLSSGKCNTTNAKSGLIYGKLRDYSGYGLGWWEKALHSNGSSHWLSPNSEWSLKLGSSSSTHLSPQSVAGLRSTDGLLVDSLLSALMTTGTLQY